jgi:hypothetical protein
MAAGDRAVGSRPYSGVGRLISPAFGRVAPSHPKIPGAEIASTPISSHPVHSNRLLCRRFPHERHRPRTTSWLLDPRRRRHDGPTRHRHLHLRETSANISRRPRSRPRLRLVHSHVTGSIRAERPGAPFRRRDCRGRRARRRRPPSGEMTLPLPSAPMRSLDCRRHRSLAGGLFWPLIRVPKRPMAVLVWGSERAEPPSLRLYGSPGASLPTLVGAARRSWQNREWLESVFPSVFRT